MTNGQLLLEHALPTQLQNGLQGRLQGGFMAASKRTSFTLSQVYGQVIYQQLSNTSQSKRALKMALRQVEISQPTWSRMMAGKVTLSFDKMKMLCDALGLDFMDLLTQVLQLAQKLQVDASMQMVGVPYKTQLVGKDILRFFIERLDGKNLVKQKY